MKDLSVLRWSHNHTIFQASLFIQHGDYPLLFPEKGESDIVFVQPFTHNDRASEVQNEIAEKLLAIQENGEPLVKKLCFSDKKEFVISIGTQWDHSKHHILFEKELKDVLGDVTFIV
jgi:hypothetical protein